MDTVQIILLVVVIILTILVVALGIQVFLILRDFRQTVHKANKVLDNTNTITKSVSEPLNNLSQLASNMATGTVFATVLKTVVRLLKSGDEKKHIGGSNG